MGRGKTYAYDEDADTRFSIDTPPPTVSGSLHMGHLYEFTLQDFVARFHRMRDDTVYFPFGFDDNGIASERLTERELDVRHQDYPRRDFQEKCRDGVRSSRTSSAGRPSWRSPSTGTTPTSPSRRTSAGLAAIFLDLYARVGSPSARADHRVSGL